MKAIIVREFGEPEVMKLEEIETPGPAATQVLVRIRAAGVNPVDTYLRTGIHAHAPKVPYTPGKDGAGIVESIGTSVTKFRAGDRVYTAGTITGTYAEFALCEEKDLGRLPDNTSYEEGAGIWTPYATSWRALFEKAHAKAGETVLVHGASGAVGIAAVQWAKHAGLRVFGTASSDAGKMLILEQGADKVFDHSADDYLEEVFEQADNKGADIIVEMLANENLEKDFSALAMFGRIVVIGNRGSLQFTPRLAMTKDATIYGASLFNAPQSTRDEIHLAIYKGLSEGYLRPVVREAIPLSDAARAHHYVVEKKGYGKIVLVP